MVTGMRNLAYEERLKKLNLTTLAQRRCRGDMIQVYKLLNNIDHCNLRLQATSYTTTRGHSSKLQKPYARLDIRKYFFSCRIVNEWNNLPDNVVSAPTLNAFKNAIDLFYATEQRDA